MCVEGWDGGGARGSNRYLVIRIRKFSTNISFLSHPRQMATLSCLSSSFKGELLLLLPVCFPGR